MCPDELWSILVLSIILTIVLTLTRMAIRTIVGFLLARVRSQPEAESEG
jgi:hypothetical protein